jgi:exodeoxyribonuclease VII large subunit
VAVVTSPTGAAIRDILQVLERRSAAPGVVVLPAPVQGADAPARIAAQIRRAWVYNLGEVIILARGGGSLEDLMAFNEEVVVRAIAECTIPLISGVGHEIDITLADLAADVRAATPSAAAELVSDRSEDLLIRSRGFRRQAGGMLLARLDGLRRTLKAVDTRQLKRLATSRLEEAMRRTDEARRSLNRAADSRLTAFRRRLELAGRSLEDASPSAVMKRGYARVSLNGRGVTDAAELSINDLIALDFSRGSAGASVVSIKPETGKEGK